MKKRKFLSLTLVCSLFMSALNSSFSYASANQYTEEIQPEDKITNALSDMMDTCLPNEKIPVVLWYNTVSDSEIENRIEEKIGYNLENLEVEYEAPSKELLNELAQAANGEPDEYINFLMKKHMELTADSRALEKAKTDLYQETRLSVVKEINKNISKQLLDKINIQDSEIYFISSLAPMIVCEMNYDEINCVAKFNCVNELDYFTPLETLDSSVCSNNFGTTKSTVGINRINDILNLDGIGVSIGIYETSTIDSRYYGEYYINSSHVNFVGPQYHGGIVNGIDLDAHATSSAGIAAGGAGIAPAAEIYSASCENDWNRNSSNTTYEEYQNKRLQNFEDLLDVADIISISWGFNNNNYWVKYVDSLIYSSGKTIVCATGNDNYGLIQNPASAYNCIAVNGFVDSYSGLAVNDYSYDHGNGCFKPDVLGPSLNNGTSTATPYIAGMIALLYQYKPSLKVNPELTKAILLASCHKKCRYILYSGNTLGLEDYTETIENGITDRQGAGIPDMYTMISIASQHTYGKGELTAENNFERKIKMVQPKYFSTKLNVSMAYLQTNVSNGVVDNCDLSVTGAQPSNLSNSSTEMVYCDLSDSPDYEIHIYKQSGNSPYIRYGYAWSTNNDRFVNSYKEEGVYYLKNYKSKCYLQRNVSNNRAYQSSINSNSSNRKWILDGSSYSYFYSIKNANILSNGLGKGSAIGSNYYAIEGNSASVAPIIISYNIDGTYTFKMTINGSIYALGIQNQSVSDNAYAVWTPYNLNDNSQKWYLETVNYRAGDVNYDGMLTATDSNLLLQYLGDNTVFTKNIQLFLADADKDNIIDISDVALLTQFINQT